MDAFLRNGWQAYGTDPDNGYVQYGLSRLQAPIAVQRAEDMVLEPHSYDLIVIAGSLEHVFDPNKVMAICRAAAAPNALLLLEGRGLAQARQTGRCGHNHRRFLSAVSIELLMLKYDWEPIWVTDGELCGPSRPQSIFGLGRARAKSDPEAFYASLGAYCRDAVDKQRQLFTEWSIR